jgi:hypothetical protein
MSDQAIEQEIQTKGKTAPRVTPADIEANIAETHYFTASNGVRGAAIADGVDDGSTKQLDLLTFCVLVLRNGFTVTGESACASPENFDDEIGRKIARENAKQKIWPLMGYALKQHLHERAVFAAEPKTGGQVSFLPPHQQRVIDERAELVDKCDKLYAFCDSSPVFAGLPAGEQQRLRNQLVAMNVYADILTERIAAF